MTKLEYGVLSVQQEQPDPPSFTTNSERHTGQILEPFLKIQVITEGICTFPARCCNYTYSQ